MSTTLTPLTPLETAQVLLCRRATQAADVAITSLVRRGNRWVAKTGAQRAHDAGRFDALAEALFEDLQFRPDYRAEQVEKLQATRVSTLFGLKQWLVTEALAAQGDPRPE